MLRAALLEEGVSLQHVDVIPDEQEAVSHALSLARHGDLLLIFADALARTWGQVVQFHPDGSNDRHESPPLAVPVNPVEMNLDESHLIRDERGVRLAREVESSD